MMINVQLRQLGLAISAWLCAHTAPIQLAIAQESPKNMPLMRVAASSPANAEMRFIQVERANIYAGPGDDFYPTSIAKQGDSVEVHQRTADGWLAIRPPAGSFSWIPAVQGFLLPGGRIIEVTDASAVSWIGSALGTAKQYRWQVRLNQGEQLSILGEQTMSDQQAEKPTLWFKIAPPNGEYRWIQEQATSSEPPQLVAADASGATAESAETNASVRLATQPQSILTSAPSAGSREAVQPNGNRGTPTGRLTNMRTSIAHVNQPTDPWGNWHAVEFKNGSLSFPGFSRMLGIEPAPPAHTAAHYDPFDLAAGPTRAPAGATTNADSLRANTNWIDPSTPSETALAGTASGTIGTASSNKRGWRDPRTFRELRESGLSTADANSNFEESPVILAGGITAQAGDAAMEDRDAAVGTSVVPASATKPVSTNNSAASTIGNDATWFGIQQAPPSTALATPAANRPLQISQADLSEIQLRLSEMVAGAEQNWNLAPLAERTRYFIEHGATAIQRGEARLLLDRIEAFADVARRSSELGITPAAPTSLANTPAATNSTLNAVSLADKAAQWISPLGVMGPSGLGSYADPASSVAPRFDATGWVVPVHSQGRDMPTHALTNDAGKIIVYLTPAAGTNLARFQSQAIGVYGLRGYLPQLKANHIQVQRAVRLQ